MYHHFYIKLFLLTMQFYPMSGSNFGQTLESCFEALERVARLFNLPEACPPLNCAAPLVHLRRDLRQEDREQAEVPRAAP